MKVELTGTIRAALGTSSLTVEVPAEGVSLSRLLELLAEQYPRSRRYLQGKGGSAVLRAVHNGSVVVGGEDPMVQDRDSVLLLHAVAGGSG